MPPSDLISLNQSLVKRILLAVDALNEADQLSSPIESSEFNLMRSILMADLALELATPVICEAFNLDIKNPQRGKTPHLGEYIESIRRHNTNLNNIDYLSNRVISLHENRNRVQHSGISFSRDSTRRMCEDAREYIEFIFQNSFGKAIDEINASLSISNELSQFHVNEAIQYKKDLKYYESAVSLAIAYRISEDFLLGRNVDLGISTPEESRKRRSIIISSPIYSTLNDRPFAPQIERRVKKSLEIVAEILQLQQIGLSNSEISFFIDKLPYVSRSVDSQKYNPYGAPISYSREEIERLINITTRAIWNMQNISFV
ncbi:hypothetical protein [Deinococcus sp. RIT780]|uniref:hypothetical protein n=1 Tax=Deinococcus sp. RIT780 TaxID=2870472 RepID=UPI001C8AA2A2|nr:hypothetical protein [Deinococcus sp. RIT780]MBX8466923.1 hypothetical protein [Deinococcus sp. RIT780]